jgi:tetratricopeptide (TPR) repeat protein
MPLFLITITLAITACYAVAAVYYPQLYVFATYEDMYGEWGQAYFFLATGIFSLLNVLRRDSSPDKLAAVAPEPAEGQPEASKSHFKWFFALLAAAAFYTFLEEISWGQRLIGFDTPGFFSENSYQDEANLHNLLTGPVETWAKTALTYLLALGFIGYGVIFPLTLKARWKPALFLGRWGLPAPPLALLPAFVISAVCELELFAFNEAEVAELLVAMSMAFTALHYWLNNNPRRLYYFMAVTLAVGAAAFTTTQTLLNNPSQKSEIEHRLANGYEKFADRYERYDHYRAIAQVLEFYDQLKPNNTVVLRRIADNYRLADDTQKADEFVNRAIEAGLKRYAEDPDNVPSNISLAKSYHLANRPEKVYFYGFHAYQLALKNHDKEPDNAYWAYWLAKACEQINQQQDALKYYREAYHLEPDNSRYERAYHEKKQRMAEFYEEHE